MKGKQICSWAMATMDRPRIVRCPRCLALLQEPPPGTPLYKCGNCSTVLRAKHAATEGSGTRRVSERPQRHNRSNPAGHPDSVDARSLPAKPMPPDHMSSPANLNDRNDIRSGTGMNRPTAVAARKNSPSYSVHHGNPGPGPPTRMPNNMNVNHDSDHRSAHDDRSLSPPNPLTVRRNRDDDVRGREAPANVPQTKASSPVNGDVNSGRSPFSHVHHKDRSPPGAVPVNSSAVDDLTGERMGRIDLLSRNAHTYVNTNSRLETSTTDLVVEGACPKPQPANMASESPNYREKEKQRKSDDEGDNDFSPTRALSAIQNAGPLYKLKERQKLGPGPKSSFSPRGSLGGPSSRGRNKSLGDEYLEGRHTDLVHDKNLESGPSSGGPTEEKPGLHRRQSSDSVAISAFGNDIFVGHPGLHTIRRRGFEDHVTGIDKSPEEESSVRRLSPNMNRVIQSAGVAVDKQKSRDHSPSGRVKEVPEVHGRNSTARISSSDIISQLNDTNSELSIPSEQGLPSGGDISLVQWRQQKDLSHDEFHKEKLVIKRDPSDDERKSGELLVGQSSRTGRMYLSPSRNVVMSPPGSFPKYLGGGFQLHPEHFSKSQERSRQVSDTPSIQLDVYGLPDVLDYDTSDDSSNVDDPDPYPIDSKLHSEELKPPTLSHKRQGDQVVEVGGDSGRSDYEEEQDLAETRSDSSSEERLDVTGKFGPVVSSGSPRFSPHLSPESVYSANQFQARDQREQPVQENLNGPSESSNSVGFGEEKVKGSAYSLLKGKSQTIRLQINFHVPDRIHVVCRHCKLQLEVPQNLSPSESGVQKLRCGSCWKISRFRLNHLLELCGGSSPAASDNSPESSFRLGSNSSDGYSGTRSNRETGSQDRVVIRTQSGASLPVPPSGRHNPRAASGSKLVNMVLGSNLPSETSKTSSPNTSGDLGPSEKIMRSGKENADLPPSSEAELVHTTLSPTFSSTSQDVGTSRQQKISPDRKLLQSSSDSDEEKASVHLKIRPSALPTPMSAWPLDTPDFDDGQELKGLKAFFKRSVKELTKGKKANQYRRKVVVNGHALPDDVVKKAEEYAGFIHPGSYWYDIRAGFWGVMGGPCLGMIPPFIEELNFTLARHCSHGKTGVLVNGRELHHKDLELLKKRGLPGTPGKSYNVDIDGRLTEAETGVELKGLGRLAPTLEQTGRGPGMWVPESQRVS